MAPTNSCMWFDPQLRARTKDLLASIKAFVHHLMARESEMGLRARTRKQGDRHKFATTVEALVCNLLLIDLVGDETTLAVPFDNNMMWGRSRYRNPIYGQHFLSVLKLMERLKLVSRVKKGFRISSTHKASSLVESTTAFYECFPPVTLESFRREQEPEILILKASKDKHNEAALVNYADSQKTRRLRNQVDRLNKWLIEADIKMHNATSPARLSKDGEVIATYRRTVRRTFNNKSWQQGGRLYGGFWMVLPRGERTRLRINEEPCVNVDYEQLYPRLAYVRAVAVQPVGDLYDVIGDGTGRDGWKMLLNALLFTRGALKNWPLDCSALLPGLKLKQAIALLTQKHAPIAHLFGTGVGFELMFIESEMLIAVVTHLFESGTTALPLHDAVLVGESHAETAKAAMEYAFCSQTGGSRAFVKVKDTPLK